MVTMFFAWIVYVFIYLAFKWKTENHEIQERITKMWK